MIDVINQNYCKKCRTLVVVNSKGKCFLCNCKTEKPQDNSVIYLVTKEFVVAGMLEEMLKNNNIQYLKESIYGAGITKGAMFDQFSFYVKFDDYEKAKQLLDEYFNNQ